MQLSWTTVVIILIVALIIYWFSKESFTTIDDKARVYVRWFATNPNPVYVNFLRDNPDSNIVEYNKMMALRAQGRMGIDEAIRALRIA